MTSESDDRDVNSHKTDQEPGEHENRTPEDQLVCSAEAIENRKFLGFIQSALSKECQPKNESTSKMINTDIIDLTEDSENSFESCSNSKSAIFPNPYYSLPSSHNKKCGGVEKLDENTSNDGTDSLTSNELIAKTGGPFPKFVLLLKASEEENPISIMQRNASLNNQKMKWRYRKNDQNVRVCSLFLNNQLLTSVPVVSGVDMRYVRESVAQGAIDKLQESCFTIKVKAEVFSDTKVDRLTLQDPPAKESKPKIPQQSNLEKELGSDNVGLKLMKLMGWAGGGLGKNQQGIEEPIKPPTQIRREGLGMIVKKKTTEKPKKQNCKKEIKKQISKKALQKNETVSFKSKVRACITNWLESNSDEDLVFSPEFDQKERKVMHKVAEQMKLKSESYGTDDNRYLVISKKPSLWQIVEELAAAGGSSDKYELIHPSTA